MQIRTRRHRPRHRKGLRPMKRAAQLTISGAIDALLIVALARLVAGILLAMF